MQSIESTPCNFEGCDRQKKWCEYCPEHRRQEKQGKELKPIRARVSGQVGCNFPGCDRGHKSLGYCSTHYMQVLKNRPLTAIRGWTGYLNNGCIFPRCSSPAFVRDLCQEHQSLRSTHHLTDEQIVSLFDAPQVCSICGENPGDRRLSIDHDHLCCPGIGSCGKCVRGLLCRQCNLGIGNLRDDPALLMRAIDYLNSYKGVPT